MSEAPQTPPAPTSPEPSAHPAGPVLPGRSWPYVGVALGAGLVGMLLGLLLLNVAERKHEAREVALILAPIDETVDDPAVWGKSFPSQYDSYLRTVDTVRTRYGGSEAFQKLDADPVWRTIFAGYAFSIDYREERGHAYMLTDQRETERVLQRPQPGSCLQCHASNVVAYRKVGRDHGVPGSGLEPATSPEGLAQLHKGFEVVCAQTYGEATKQVTHPVACIDCHDPKSLGLRVTRPGFLTGIAAFARGEAPAPHLPSIERWRAEGRRGDYDPNRDASRQELRSMACGQCHVEYYFRGPGKVVTYPWERGLRADDIEGYYDAVGFSDWKHERSGAPVLKAQHPEFETWSQGIHARSGVACADCHMPYVRRGAIKVTDHHVRSPLLNITRSCQVCHAVPETELLARAEAIQERTNGLLDRAELAVNDVILAIERAAKERGESPSLDPARALQRRAQWRLDFVSAENSMGFHAPQETARLLAEAIDFARQGQIAVVGSSTGR